MGIYIPNMDKPKACAECELWSLCFYPKAPKEIDDRVMPDCPLEEIDLVRCKECKRCEERTTLNGLSFLYCLKMEVSVGSDQYCYWGERRNDE